MGCNSSRDEFGERRWRDEARTEAAARHHDDPSREAGSLQASLAEAAPKLRYRKPADRRSRPQRWRDAVAELLSLQGEYQVWLDAVPESLEGSSTAEVLRMICDLELLELERIELPRGFGRD
jgi:hypothetical protein